MGDTEASRENKTVRSERMAGGFGLMREWIRAGALMWDGGA